MKNARHEEILKLITKYEIETQEELATRLNEAGFAVTQATVSRDIRALSLHKVQGSGGKLHYASRSEAQEDIEGRYRRVLGEAFVSLEISYNVAVIHTVSGMAMAAAAALDHMGWDELLGCIAGDDTIIGVIRTPGDAETFRKRIEGLLGG